MNPLLRPLLAIAGRVTGGPPPHIFSTLARHPKLFVSWLVFAGRLMPRGRLPRAETELVILRVAWNCANRYEWDHHVRIGRRAGLSDADIERVPEGRPPPTGASAAARCSRPPTRSTARGGSPTPPGRSCAASSTSAS